MTKDQQAALEQVAADWMHLKNLPEGLKYELAELLAAQRTMVLEEAQCIVDSEEELPGDMPNEMFQAITVGDKAFVVEALRAVVRATKKSIASRLSQQAKEIPS